MLFRGTQTHLSLNCIPASVFALWERPASYPPDSCHSAHCSLPPPLALSPHPTQRPRLTSAPHLPVSPPTPLCPPPPRHLVRAGQHLEPQPDARTRRTWPSGVRICPSLFSPPTPSTPARQVDSLSPLSTPSAFQPLLRPHSTLCPQCSLFPHSTNIYKVPTMCHGGTSRGRSQ